MHARIAPLFLATALSLACFSVHSESYKEEKASHPRIAKAIAELRDAVKYMEAAPHDFGGNKAAAIASSNLAIKDLQEALKYRAAKDTKKGK